MGVENILIIVYVWHQRMPGTNTQEIYKNVIERGKDLLQILHQRVLEAEQQLSVDHQASIIQKHTERLPLPQIPFKDQKKSQENLMAYGRAKRQQFGGNGNAPRNTNDGIDLTTKVYPSDVIPDKKEYDKANQRGVFRQNNFLNDPYVTKQLGLQANQQQEGDQEDNQDNDEDDELEVELT